MEENHVKKLKVSVYLRIIVGGYLLYLAYDLLDHFDLERMFDDKVVAIFGFLYLILGIALCIWGCIGYYDEKKKDKGSDESL